MREDYVIIKPVIDTLMINSHGLIILIKEVLIS